MLYREACNRGDFRGCLNLGAMYSTGGQVAQDPVRALKLFQEACDGGNIEGCARLAPMYEQAMGTSRDMELALKLYKKACDAGNQPSCYRYAHHQRLANSSRTTSRAPSRA